MGKINVKKYLDMDLLRFTTAGSVDDGKSTLIGRLLYDSKSIFQDQMEAVERSSKQSGDERINLALLTDGLKAEREQGITIDVAYRYFATPKRKFIIADTPGHIQYTRNMVTGASTANLAVILVDARKGVSEQTCRHTYIASLLQIRHAIVCINKMDLVQYSKNRFKQIQHDFEQLSQYINTPKVIFIPISALHGDNVVDKSPNMDWFQGAPLLTSLENIKINAIYDYKSSRFPVQRVIRPQNDDFHDFRGYAGRVSGGVFSVGNRVTILPSNKRTKIKSIQTMDKQLESAYPPMSVCLTLEDDIDISRGDMLVKEDNFPIITQNITLTICWLNANVLKVGNKYILKHTTQKVRCIVQSIDFKMNINTLEKEENNSQLELNDIGQIKIKTTASLFIDEYSDNRITGSLLFIDAFTHETVGAGMVVNKINIEN